jgi:uncharacterized damage-inducible protein DinB
VKSGLNGEASNLTREFQLIILSMERTLDSTVLHTVRTRLLEDFPGQIVACLDALSDEQLWWRPNERANAVANLVLHLAGSNRYYLEHVIGGRPTERNRDAEFAARGGLSKAEIRETWNRAVQAVGSVLAGLQEADLMRTSDRSGKVSTYAQVLLHVSHHNAVHLGQIVWVTKMLQPGAIDELWMKMRGR